MPKTKNSVKIDEAYFISKYMEYLVEHDVADATSYDFCLYCHASEPQFGRFFDSIEHLEKIIWDRLMQVSIKTVQQDLQYPAFTQQERILSLYYTFFENLTLNRAYCIQNLEHRKSLREKISLFKLLRTTYSDFIDEIFEKDNLLIGSLKINPIEKFRKNTLREGFWLLLIFLIDFWRKDESPELEKTDVAIEKSVKVAIDLIDTSRFMNVVDLGKFLWQERGNYSFKK